MTRQFAIAPPADVVLQPQLARRRGGVHGGVPR